MRRCKKNISVKNFKGFTFIEVLIASILSIFVLIAAFYAIGNILSSAVLSEKKVELVDELESRVDNYMLTGNFDDSPLGNITFSRVGSGSSVIREFVATNPDFSLQVVKRTYSVATPETDAITQILGAYMAKVWEIYSSAGATRLDESPELRAAVEQARRDYLDDGRSTMIASGHITNVLLNIGNTPSSETIPRENPLVNENLSLRIELMTDADVTPNGLIWHCSLTPATYEGEILPSWCIL
ncbi:prepilin-type N-terminal cleavage/methylation domain-containing protein [Francisella philomiragia]|uniref:Pilus assembly protein n=1 Tax=Francisella philomiragia subsp. philomiragia (strain ATCC 25017 / CCUG 19701 / FSC 153 / O\|nr:prepilin-type N-terminal cleavage/methylation domain-containing protein [Francisella philomiragia]AJI47902.1 putative pilus assembly protein [Francisella philomiragia]AJI49229.1 putative pilus assembly protein [Francisella philomiragia]MBK2019802.1 prepilin-type N-terminal cleavage/methylation domain-containing protein [Francisella philomiragia]MBK2029744.1 prepilin-type N-terminal cleavage/methylation domain-containing protein [Francisella philomiragia]MBK2263680.1 prepilin-type N-terminal